MTADDQTCSLAEFAVMRGWSDSYARRMARKGRLVLDGERRVRVAESVDLVAATADPAHASRMPGIDPRSSSANGSTAATRDAHARAYTSAATREKVARASLAELELARRGATLVDAADVERAVFNLGRTARESIMSIPDRMATVIAGETDPTRVHALLRAEVAAVCAQIVAGAVDLVGPNRSSEVLPFPSRSNNAEKAP